MRIKKGKRTREGKKRKKTKAHPGGSGTAIRVHINGWPQNREIGWCVGGCWITPALLQALFTFLHSESTLYLFIYFFLQKVVAALQEPVVLVGKNTQLGAIDLGR